MAAVLRGGKSDACHGSPTTSYRTASSAAACTSLRRRFCTAQATGWWSAEFGKITYFFRPPASGCFNATLGTTNRAAAAGGPATVKLKLPEIAADGESARLTQSSVVAANVPSMAGLAVTLSFQVAGTSTSTASNSPAETRKRHSHVVCHSLSSHSTRVTCSVKARAVGANRHRHGRRGGGIGVERTHRPPAIRLALGDSGLDVRQARATPETSIRTSGRR